MDKAKMQEMFDKAWLGLKAQRFRRSVDEEEACLYRGPDGNRCGIGHLIDDEVYSLEMEGRSVSDLLKSRLLALPVPGEFLSNLQGVHDDARNAREVERGMRDFASEYGLTVPT